MKKLLAKDDLVKKCLIPLGFLLFSLPFLPALSITVFDKELGIPLEGVRIEAAGAAPVVTDADGKAELALGGGPTTVLAQTPGYEPAKARVKAGELVLEIRMVLAGVVEGKELVVEKSKPQKTDAQAGVSAVATRQDIRSTGEIGIVEDVMSTIKMLPGVGYTGGWNAMPSMRGGDPRETSFVLDGAPVDYPYHWGGAFTIFNPDMVESAKLSNGLISARYGQVLSGLIEVTSKTPKNVVPQFDLDTSTTGLALFVQSPLGPNAGLLAGGKVTWMDVSFALAGQSGTFDTVPYIRDSYARVFWKPTDKIDWSLNTFLATDGIGLKFTSGASTVPGDNLTSSGSFRWSNVSFLASTNLKFLLDENNLFDVSASFNQVKADLAFQTSTSGTKTYDQAFIDSNATLLGGATGYTLTNLTNQGNQATLLRTYQGRTDFSHQFGPGHLVTFGAEETLNQTSDQESSNMWVDVPSGQTWSFQQVSRSLDVPKNSGVNSGAYLIDNFDFGGLVTGEGGLRVDHTYLFNDSMALNTIPVVNPRVRMAYTPVKNMGWVDSFAFTAGSGLYSQLPLQASLFDPSYHLTADSLQPNRAWFNLLGLELLGNDGWKFTLEGYYKNYFNRLYIGTVPGTSGTNGSVYDVHTDGVGYAWGVDVLIQKQTGRYWDGWLTYSYVVARFLNPSGVSTATDVLSGDPIGSWYYPNYQRFHNLNLILNWKPVTGFMTTLTASVATGAPRDKVGAITSYASTFTDSSGRTQVIERFSRTSAYDDALRNDISCPVNLKFTWSGYYPETKVRWEYYLGLENVFANFYTPKSNPGFDRTTGKESSGGSADFSIGFPVPSVGYKLSY